EVEVAAGQDAVLVGSLGEFHDGAAVPCPDGGRHPSRGPEGVAKNLKHQHSQFNVTLSASLGLNVFARGMQVSGVPQVTPVRVPSPVDGVPAVTPVPPDVPNIVRESGKVLFPCKSINVPFGQFQPLPIRLRFEKAWDSAAARTSEQTQLPVAGPAAFLQE